jgi:hypothetical protein
MCRGFHVCYIREDSAVPERVDTKTGAVSTILKPCHKFRISFDARGPRDDIKVRKPLAAFCIHKTLSIHKLR